MGVGTPAREAVEPAPRRARAGRVRDARQDLQGPDRRDARMADREAPPARDGPRRPRRLRAAGACGGDRLRRRANEPAVSRRGRAALRPRRAPPAGQAGGAGGHDRSGAQLLFAAMTATATMKITIDTAPQTMPAVA